MSATNIVADDWKDVNPTIWSPAHIALLKTAARDNEVERVLVNPAIKKALCRDVSGDRSWLHKMRPVYGHNYHFHIRISCPRDRKTASSRSRPPTKAAARTSTGGSETRTQSPDRAGRRSRCPRCRPPAGRCCWRTNTSEQRPHRRKNLPRRQAGSAGRRRSSASRLNVFDHPAAERRGDQAADHQRHQILQRRHAELDEERGGGRDGDKKLGRVHRADRLARRVARADQRRGRDRTPAAAAAGIEEAGDEADRRSPSGRRVARRGICAAFIRM